MNEPVILKTPLARIDLAGCYAYIGERNLDASRRFRLAAEGTFVALGRMPGIGAHYDEVANPRLSGLRACQVRRFRRYLVFYLTLSGGIEVVRVCTLRATSRPFSRRKNSISRDTAVLRQFTSGIW